MKRAVLWLLLTVAPVVGAAELVCTHEPDPDLPRTGPAWVPQGPAPMTGGQVENLFGGNSVVGAVQAVVPHPGGGGTAWVAGINGGVWRTDDLGSASPDYTAQTDELPSLSISSLNYDRTEPTPAPDAMRLVAGVGRFSNFARLGGRDLGVLLSDDGGQTWCYSTSGTIRNAQVSGVARQGNVVVAVDARINHSAVLRSTNGGRDWAAAPAPIGRAFWLAQDPTTPDRLFVAIWAAGIYRSDDFGATWTLISTGTALHADLTTNFLVGDSARVTVNAFGRLIAATIKGGRLGHIAYTDDPTVAAPAWVEMDPPGLSLSGPAAIQNVAFSAATGRLVVTSNAHGITEETSVRIEGVNGIVQANGIWRAIPDPTDLANRFELLNSTNPGAAMYAGGGTWRRYGGLNPNTAPGGQGAINFTLGVHPTSTDRLFSGGDVQAGSPSVMTPNPLGATDFTGNIWMGDSSVAPTGSVPSPQWSHRTHSNTSAPGSAPHADSRVMEFDTNGDVLEGDDGGLYRLTQPLTTTGRWSAAHGDLQVTEVHSVAWDPLADVLLSGNQDTGTGEQTASGSTTWRAREVADGGDVAVDRQGGLSVRYFSIQRLGFMVRHSCNGSNACDPPIPVARNGISPTVIADGYFTPPIATNSHADGDDRLLILNRKGAFESMDLGENFVLVGGTTELMGGTTALDPVYGHPLDVNFIALSREKDVYVRSGPSPSLQKVGTSRPADVTGVAVDPADVARLYAGTASQVFEFKDGSWMDATGNLSLLGADPPTEANDRNFFEDLTFVAGTSGAPDKLFVAGRTGVFATAVTRGGPDPGVVDECWTEIGTALPDVWAYDIEYDPSDDVLIVGTLGRGTWKLSGVSTILVDCQSDLALSLDSTAPDPAVVGDTVTWVVTLENRGHRNPNVVVDFALDHAARSAIAATISGAGANCDVAAAQCTVDEMAPQEVRTITITATADGPGDLRLTAGAAGDLTDDDPTNSFVEATIPVQAFAGCTISFDGGEDQSPSAFFSTAVAWTGDRVPGATDQVCIADGFTVFAGTATIQSLISEGILEIQGGNFEVAGLAQVRRLELTGGEFRGTGQLEISESMFWNAGVIRIAGGVRILGGATLTVEDRPNQALIKGLRVSLDNSGTVTITGSDDLYVSQAGLEGVTIHNRFGASFQVDGDVDLPVVENDGTFQYTGLTPAMPSIFALRSRVPLTVDRDLDIRDLRLEGAATLTQAANTQLRLGSGQLDPTSQLLADAASIEFDFGPIDTPAPFTVAGVFTAGSILMNENAFVDFTASSTATTGTLDLLRGELTGDGTLGVSGPMSITFGVQSGAGTTIAGDGVTVFGGALRGRTLELHGLMDLRADLLVQDDCTIHNTADGTIEFGSAIGFNEPPGSQTPCTLVNDGALTKTGSVSTTIDTSLTGSGTLAVDEGIFIVSEPAELNGSATLAATTRLTFERGLALSGDIGGTGQTEVKSGILSIGTPQDPIQSVSVEGELRLEATSIEFDLAGTTPGMEHDRITVGAFSLIAGQPHEIRLTLANGFVPAQGNLFRLIEATGGFLSQPFGSTALPALPAGLGWSKTAATAAYELEVIGGADAADLSLLVGVGPEPVQQGQNLVYTATVTNNGPDTAVGVQLRQLLPSFAQILTATVPGGTCSLPTVAGNPLGCALPDLANGAAVAVTITVRPNASGLLNSTLEVNAPTNDPNAANDVVSLQSTVVPPPTADLSVALELVGQAIVGQTATVRATVTNAGPDAATGLTLSQVFLGEGYTTLAVRPLAGSCAGASSCSLATLANGASWVVELDLQWTDPGNFRDDVSVTANEVDPTLPNTDFLSFFVGLPAGADLAVTIRTAAPAATVGSVGRFTVTLQNRGPSQAQAATVSLGVTGPAGAAIVGATPSQGTCTAATPFVCDVGDLFASMTIEVDTGVSADGRLSLAASAAAVTEDQVDFNDRAVTSIRFDTGPALGLAALLGTSGWNAPGNPGTLYSVDESTGATAAIGDVLGSGGIEGLAADDQGRLWGVSTTSATASSQLIRIDPGTGAVLQTIGTVTNFGFGLRISDLAFDPVGRRLLGVVGSMFGGGDLMVIDTGNATTQYLAFAFFDTDSGLAFTPDGRLFAASRDGALLHERDPANGFFVAQTALTTGYHGLVGRPDGALLGASGSNSLSTIDPDTGLEVPLAPGPGDHLGDLAYASASVRLGTTPVGSRMGAAGLSWDSAPGATSYDVFFGDLGLLRASGGDYAVAIDGCLGEDVTVTTLDTTTLNPTPGTGLWFLVAANGASPFSSDVMGEGLWASRDAEASASTNGCNR